MNSVSPARHYLIALGGAPFPVSKDEFLALKQARSILIDALAFEQKFELLRANWLALEVAVVELGLQAKVDGKTEWYEKGSEWFNVLNRHIMNMLTTACAYEEQVRGDFKDAQMSPTFKEAAAKRFSLAFDSSFHYRFMDALRNVAQHGQLPVHNVGGSDRNHHWSESLSFHAHRKEIEGDRHFRAKTLEETPDSVDLRVASRDYVGNLSEVHVDLRKLVDPYVESARLSTSEALTKYENATGGKFGSLHAIAPESEQEEPVLVMLDWDNVRVKLAAKNAYRMSLDGAKGS